MPVLPTVVMVMAAFVNVCVPIVPLPVNWNVHVSVCAIPAKAPNVKKQMSEMMVAVIVLHHRPLPAKSHLRTERPYPAVTSEAEADFSSCPSSARTIVCCELRSETIVFHPFRQKAICGGSVVRAKINKAAGFVWLNGPVSE